MLNGLQFVEFFAQNTETVDETFELSKKLFGLWLVRHVASVDASSHICAYMRNRVDTCLAGCSVNGSVTSLRPIYGRHRFSYICN